MVLKNILFVPYWYYQLCYYAKRSKEIPEEKKQALLNKIIHHANKKGRVKVRAYGIKNIPKVENFIYFPNHQGLYDVLAIMESSPRFFSVVMKKELKNIFFLKEVFRILEACAIDRDDVRQSMKVIQEVSKEVSEGKNFLIFPEGTRSRDKNTIGGFKGGSFKSATKAKCPIVPVAVIDSYKVFDNGSTDEVTVQIHYLEPLYYEDYKMMKTTEIAEIVSERIKKTIDNYMSV